MAVLAAPAFTRRWPPWGRFLTATLLVGLILVFQAGWPGTAGYPFLFYLGAVVICAVLFDQATSVFATFLSAVCLAYVSLEPRYSFAIEDSRSAFALAYFVLVCLFIGFLIELLHLAVYRLHDANEALRRANRELTASDQEKDLLLREAAHRTKNDLLTLVAMIRLEQRRQRDECTRQTLQKLAQRVQVFVKLQDRLSRAKLESVVDAGAYVKDLCDALAVAVSGARSVTLNVRAESHTLPASHAVALGLITNELVTNALKHALSDDQPGTVDVKFKARGGECLLCVEDDGRGLPEPVQDSNNGTGHGRGLLRSMVQQLDGSFELNRRSDGPGTIARVSFPAQQA